MVIEENLQTKLKNALRDTKCTSNISFLLALSLALPSPLQMINLVNQFQYYLFRPKLANLEDGDGGFGRSPSTIKKRF